MTPTIRHVSAISLFVEDVEAAKNFYRRVFGADAVYEDENSLALKFDNLIINLLRAENALTIIEPGTVAPPDAGSRFQLTVWVRDVDAVCDDLRKLGVKLLAGPIDRPWGVRTANFVDPAGHSWEVGQQLASGQAKQD